MCIGGLKMSVSRLKMCIGGLKKSISRLKMSIGGAKMTVGGEIKCIVVANMSIGGETKAAAPPLNIISRVAHAASTTALCAVRLIDILRGEIERVITMLYLMTQI